MAVALLAGVSVWRALVQPTLFDQNMAVVLLAGVSVWRALGAANTVCPT